MKKSFLGLFATFFTLVSLAQPQVGKTYHIKADGRYVCIEGSQSDHDIFVVMSDAGNEEEWATKWAVVEAGKGDGTIVAFINPHSKMGIDQAPETATKFLQTWGGEQGNANQQFMIEEADGGYLIANAAGKYVYVNGDNLIMSTRGTVFEFEETTNDEVLYPGSSVRIRNKQTGQVIGTDESIAINDYLQMEDKDEARQGQVWTLKTAKYSDSSHTHVYILVNDKSGLGMDLALESKRTLLQWTASTTSNNQMVLIEEVNEGEYMITSAYRPTYIVTLFDWNWNNYIYVVASDQGDNSLWTMEAANSTIREGHDWENEKIFGINKLDGHAAFMPYRNEQALRADASRLERPWLDPVGADWMSLDGTWKFHFSSTADARPLDFFETGYDVSAWDDIAVPGCIEMHGYDRPMYLNVAYPFADNPPYVPVAYSGTGESPVGSYRRTFTLPADWEGRRTILHFDGIYSGAYVWVNGEKVGYTQGGNMDAEFDVTPYVKSGDNDLAVQVFRWTDGSYLEGQDMFRMSGIHRSVSLYSVPQTYITDHVIKADYSGGYASVPLTIDLSVNTNTATSRRYFATILDPSGAVVSEGEFLVADADCEDCSPIIEYSANIANPQMYSSESPSLYTVIIRQEDLAGNEEMAFATKWGFCDVTYNSQLVYVNGSRVYFKGVNTQDTHPVLGRTIDNETMWRDLTLMKQANVNMVRTSHYPRMTRMNDMMLYLGIYICDEADVECHRNWDDGGAPYKIADELSWQPAMLDRQRRMVQRDRNNSAVVMWSLGNESYVGQNFRAAYDMIHTMDHRPVHYEGATRFWNASRGITYTDVRSQMYPTQQTITSQLNNPTQPYFMCEYAHAMGNAIGNLKDTWQKIYDSKNGIGGCIWDWVDQSIYEPADILSGDTIDANGYPKFRTGYDFPGPHQGNFVNNGIINADRAWSPELTNVKTVYQDIEFLNFSNGQLEMLSRMSQLRTDEMYSLSYSVLRNGTVVETSQAAMPSISPDDTGVANLSINTDMSDGAEYTLQVFACLKEDKPWAKSGYPMSSSEFMLQERSVSLPVVATDAAKPFTTISTLSNRAINENVTLRANEGDNVSLLKIGNLTIIPSIDDAPAYSDLFWIENDTYNGASNGNSESSSSLEINSDKTLAVYTQSNTSSKCNSIFTYTVNSVGVIDLDVSLSPQTDNLRRIGFSMKFPSTYNNIEYYARGPWENYCDRMEGSYLQRVHTTVDDMYSVYAHPQSNGDHQDLRELRMVDTESKDTLVITTQGQVGFSLSRYDESCFSQSYLHQSDLAKTDRITAHFDYMVRGLGNKSCGAETALSQYRCPSEGTYSYKLRFEVHAYDPLHDGVSAANADGSVYYADGVVTAEHRQIDVFDLGGAKVATGRGSVSLKGQPHGIYLVKVDGALYKFMR